MSHELSHSLQSAGCPNVPVSCHSCDSLLHWIVAWQTTSSEPQFEHTGVERAARPVRSSTVRGTSGIKLNGLMSAVRRICFIPCDLVLGIQPTPAITFRKITNCDVAHFVVDCRCAAERRDKSWQKKCVYARPDQEWLRLNCLSRSAPYCSRGFGPALEWPRSEAVCRKASTQFLRNEC